MQSSLVARSFCALRPLFKLLENIISFQQNVRHVSGLVAKKREFSLRFLVSFFPLEHLTPLTEICSHLYSCTMVLLQTFCWFLVLVGNVKLIIHISRRAGCLGDVHTTNFRLKVKKLMTRGHCSSSPKSTLPQKEVNDMRSL